MWDDGDRLIAVIIFSANYYGAGFEDYCDGGFDLFRILQTRDERGKMSVLYRITGSIGRWSMIDFVIIILMSSFPTQYGARRAGWCGDSLLPGCYFDHAFGLLFRSPSDLGQATAASDGLDSEQTLNNEKTRFFTQLSRPRRVSRKPMSSRLSCG